MSLQRLLDRIRANRKVAADPELGRAVASVEFFLAKLGTRGDRPSVALRIELERIAADDELTTAEQVSEIQRVWAAALPELVRANAH